VARVTGEVRECDFYQLGHQMIAMYGVFCAIVVLYQLYFTLYKYKDKQFETIIYLNENDKRDEEIPLTYGTNEISV
jgi:hypothetical protein